METFSLIATQDTPEVTLNKVMGKFKISGNSFSEDPFTIYGRIFSWLKEYSQDPNENTSFEFHLNYINTASSKQIVEILKILEDLSQKSSVEILWYYQDGDDDTFQEGEELSHMFQLNFKFIEI